MPLGFTSSVVQRSGSKIYFHPLIPISSFDRDYNGILPENEQEDYNDFRMQLVGDKRRIKYGVI